MELPTATPLRAVVYARVSTDEQREGQTIDSQIEEVRRFADQKRWDILTVYKDEGWSGSILGRPELDRLRDDASRHHFDVVIVNDVDRLARDVTHLGVIKRDLLRHEVTIVFRKLPNDNSPTNNLLVNILGSFAEFERELIADRTRRGRRYKVETRQRFLGCIAPYGYAYVTRRHSASGEGDLQVLPAEAKVVREMYRWVDEEGLSARQVVRRLNESGIRPRGGAHDWGRSSVLRILRSEVYAGVWHYNKHELHHQDEAIGTTTKGHGRSTLRRRPRSAWIPVPLPKALSLIDRPRWTRVQRQLDANITFSPRHAKHNYLLRGLLRCGTCTSPYIGDPNHGRFYYRCGSRCGKAPHIREEVLNSAVWSAVVEIVTDPALVANRLSKLIERRRAQPVPQRRDDLLRSEVARLVTEEDRLIAAYRGGILSAQALAQELERINGQRAALQGTNDDARRADHPERAELRIESVVAFLNHAAAQLTRFTDEQRQRFLRLVLRFVTIDRGRLRIIGRIPSADDIPKGDGLWGPPTNSDVDHANAQPRSLLHDTRVIEEMSCRIAPTEANLGARNTGAEFQAIVRIDATRPQQPRDGKTGQFVSRGKSATSEAA